MKAPCLDTSLRERKLSSKENSRKDKRPARDVSCCLEIRHWTSEKLLKWRYWSETRECLRKNRDISNRIIEQHRLASHRANLTILESCRRQSVENDRHSTDTDNCRHLANALFASKKTLNRWIDLEQNHLTWPTLDTSCSDLNTFGMRYKRTTVNNLKAKKTNPF